MNINNKKIIRNSIIGAAVITLLFVGKSYVYKKQNSEKIIGALTQRQIPEQISVTDVIKKATLEDYLGFVEKNKTHHHFAKRIDKHGLERTVEHIAGLEFYSIDLAAKYNNSNAEITLEEYTAIAKQIGIDEENFLKEFADERAANVEKARIEILRVTTNHYRKIISENKDLKFDADNATSIYDGLIKKTFTKEEYTLYCEKLYMAKSKFLDEIGATLGVLINLGGGEVLDKMKQLDKEHYYEVRDRIYSENGI